jgi:hypothetical protein
VIRSARLALLLCLGACSFDTRGLHASTDLALHPDRAADTHLVGDLAAHDVSDGQRSDLALDLLVVDLPCPAGGFDCQANGSARSCVAGVWIDLGVCPLGCDLAGQACRVPSNVSPELQLQGTGALSLANQGTPILVNTDTGEIRAPNGPLRPASVGLDPASGIHFSLLPQTGAPGLGVFAVTSLGIPEGTVLRVSGSRSLVLLASAAATIDGVIEVRADGATAGPGGFAGGGAGGAGGGACGGGNGQGSTFEHYCTSGGGGGGHGDAGGAGGDCSCVAPNNFAGGSAGASSCGTAALVPLVGGSGGAGGTVPTGSTIAKPGSGGGGGGAVQISAGTAIAVGVKGGVNAGGGGGGASTSAGGAGGGAGGAILLEAPVVTIAAGGVLAANGGGGGGGDCT